MSLYLYRYIPESISNSGNFGWQKSLTRKLSDVRKHVLQSICELERVHITQTELDMRIDDQFGQSKDFSNQMEGISESRLLSLLGRLHWISMILYFCEGMTYQRLDGLQIQVVVEMQVVEILSVDEKIQHIVSLSNDLKTSFHPVEVGALEELGVLETSEQVPLGHCLGSLVVKGVENIVLELKGVSSSPMGVAK